MLKVLTFTAFLVPVYCFAGLGDTEQQCVANYGPVMLRDLGQAPNGAPTTQLLFRPQSGFVTSCVMLDGKAVLILIFKTDKSALSDVEIANLLQADAPGHKWEKGPVMGGDALWRRDDGARAQYNYSKPHLTLMSPAYIAISGPAAH